MHYQKQIVERLVVGAASVDGVFGGKVRAELSPHTIDLKDFAKKANELFHRLVVSDAQVNGKDVPDIKFQAIPETYDDVPFWIEDLEIGFLRAIKTIRGEE
ncbi:MAG: hypothetical protein ACRDBQ_18150 [Shewanella sp.]